MRRWRWVGRGALVIGALLVGAGTGAVGFVAWLGTPSGNAWLRHRLVRAVSSSMVGGRLELERLGTDVVSRFEVEGLRLVNDEGRALLELPALRVRYDPWSLFRGTFRVRSLEARGLDLVLDTGPSGRLRLAELFGPPSASDEPFALPIDVGVELLRFEGTRLRMDDTLHLEGLDLYGRLDASGPVFRADELELCAHLVRPGPLPFCARGPMVWDGTAALLDGVTVWSLGTEWGLVGRAGDTLELEVAVRRLDLAGVDGLTGGAGLKGVLAGTLRLDGAGPLTIEGELRGVEKTRGSVEIALRFDGDRWGGTLRPQGLDVAQLYGGTPVPVELDGALSLDGRGFSYPDAMRLGIGFEGAVTVDSTYRLQDVVFEGVLDDGVLHVERGDFDGLAGPLGGTGTIDLVGGALVMDVRGQLVAEQLEALGIEGIGGNGWTDLTVRADLKQGDGRYRIAGSVGFAPFRYGEDVAAGRLDVRVRGWTRGTDLVLDVDARGEEVEIYGVRSDTLTAEALEVSRLDGSTTLHGPVTLTGVEGEGIDLAELDVDLDVELPKHGERTVAVDLQLGAFDLATFPGTGGTGTVRVRGDVLGFELALDDGERPFLRTAGEHDLRTGAFAVRRLELAPTPRLRWVAEGETRAVLTADGVRDARIALRGTHGDVTVTGTLGASGPLDGRVQLERFQLDTLAELFPDRFGGLAGQMELDLRLDGHARVPVIDGELDVDGLWLEGQTRWLDIDGHVAGHGPGLDLDLALGVAGEPLGRLAGRLPVDLGGGGLLPDEPVALRFDLHPGALDRFEHLTVTELGVPDGTVAGQIGIGGQLRDPTWDARLIAEVSVGGWSEPARAEMELRRDGRDLAGHLVVREGLAERGRIQLDGITRVDELFASLFGSAEAPDTSDLRLWLDTMTLVAHTDGLPVGSLLALGESDLPATGAWVGEVRLEGSPYTPAIWSELRWEDGTLAEVPVEVGHLVLRPGDGGLELQAELAFPEGALLVEGALPVAVDLREDVERWTEGPLDVHVEGEHVPLALLTVVDGVVDPKGELEVRGTIRGTLDDPRIDLEGEVRGGTFIYAPMGLSFSDTQVRVSGSGRRLKLERFVARTEPLNRIGVFDDNRASVVRATGAANVERGTLKELSARLVFDDAWVMGTYDSAMRIGGSVRVSGAWPALHVDGEVELVNGRYVYRADEAVAAAPLQPVDGLVIHRAGVSRRFEVEEEVPFYAGFDIDLGVDLKRNLEVVAVTPFFDDLGQLTATITQANVNARVGGKLDVGLNRDATWRVGGEVEVVDGTVQVLRTTFYLNEGRITLFPDALGASPLDLSAVSTIQDATIDLRIGGTVDEPSLEATSEGYDETQVLVMLLTGRSVEGLTSNQGQAASSDAAMAAAALLTSSMLGGTAAGALSIEADGSVRIGAPWSSSVFSELVLRPFADNDENLVSFAIEWALIRKLLLEAGAGDRYQWLDVSWETRF